VIPNLIAHVVLNVNFLRRLQVLRGNAADTLPRYTIMTIERANGLLSIVLIGAERRNGMSEKITAIRKEMNFERELAELINGYSRENESRTADFILAAYMHDCLKAYERAISLSNLNSKSIEKGEIVSE